MEKRTVLAIALSALILIGWSIVMKKYFPSPTPPPAPAATPSAPAAGASPSPSGAPTPAAAPPTAPAPAPAVPSEPAVSAAKEEEIRIETPSAWIVLTNRGARVRSWSLKDYRTAQHPVEFVSEEARKIDVLPLSLAFADPAALPEANRALYSVERSKTADGGDRVAFRWADGAGSSIEKTVTFPPGGGLVGVEVAARDRGRKIEPRIVWAPGLEAEAPNNRANMYYHGQALALEAGRVVRIRKVDESTVLPPSNQLSWAGLADQFFAALFVPAGSQGSVTIAPLSATALAADPAALPKEVASVPTVAVSLPDGKTQLFVGPKNFGLLRSLGHNLQRAVWFSDYTLIYAFAKPLFLALRWVHGNVASNWGVAIILLTIALRIVLFPLNQYSLVKMRKVAADMQRVQPKIKAIQAKYKKSKDPEARAKLNSETMELYRKEGVNPFGGVSGCLPMLIQMPILWAFFDVLTAAVELRGAPFALWIRDLTHPDPYYITPLLMGASMFIQQKMTPTANVDPTQQRMMMFMPIMFTVMFVTLPSGLVLYYFVNNLLGIAQQWLVNRHVARLHAEPTKA